MQHATRVARKSLFTVCRIYNATSFATRLYATNFWSEKQNQRHFVERLCKKLGFQSKEDWYKLTKNDIQKNGGSTLLSQFNNSPSALLQAVFPEEEWVPWKFHRTPQRFWPSKQNQRQYVEWLGKQLGFKTKEDWYKLTADDFKRHGGSRLSARYGSSPSALLQAVFPEEKWVPWKFYRAPRNCWSDKQNQRQFVEWLGKQLDFQTKEDWYKLTLEDLAKHGGSGLSACYGGSPSALLQAVFPEEEWLPWKFNHSPQRWSKDKDASTWHPVNRVATVDQLEQSEFLHSLPALLEQLSKALHIRNKEDWQYIPLSVIKEHEVGKQLLYWFGDELGLVLHAAFPEHEWSSSLLDRTIPFGVKHRLQKHFQGIISSLFPGEELIINARKECGLGKFAGTQRWMEVDVYLPSLNIGFEFQEAHHFVPTWFSDLSDVQARDQEKLQAAKAAGMTLFIIPMWWDMNRESLISTIRETSPDLLPEVASSVPPIPKEPPQGFFDNYRKLTGFVEGLGFPMLATWLEQQHIFDPTNWLLSEKYDGIRAFWNPTAKKFFSRSGKELSIPESILQTFIQFDCWLDGEIWFGHGQFNMALSTSIKNRQHTVHWENFQFKVFDAPMHTGTLEERLSFLNSLIPHNHSFASVVNMVKCEGKEDLQKFHADILSQGGEGIILRKPGSLYSPGSSTEFLKFKKFKDAEALVLEQQGDGLWLCERKHGVQFTAPVDQELFPQNEHFGIGDIISFKYFGTTADGQPVAPSIFRVRRDVDWKGTEALPFEHQ